MATRRAAYETPARVIRRYRSDRFARPSDTPWRALRQAEDLLARNLPPEFELVTLAPLVPLGGLGIDRLASFMADPPTRR